jgi:glycogen debranching enzyme
MFERIDVFNHSMARASSDVAIELAADFADVLEVAQRDRQQHGDMKVSVGSRGAEIRYVATRHEWRTERGLRVRVLSGDVSLRSEADGLSAEHPSLNPWAYHLGTVWPVENATFGLGFKRYGFDAEADRLLAALLDAPRMLPGNRLPELIGGQSRDDVAFPVVYPDANAPQAWSASATIQSVQIMLGLYPFAPLNLLALVRPRLPEGVEQLTINDLRVGKARVSIRFDRRGDGSASHKMIRRRGPLLVVEAPPPDAATGLSARDALASAVLARAPGRLAHAARLALGMLD